MCRLNGLRPSLFAAVAALTLTASPAFAAPSLKVVKQGSTADLTSLTFSGTDTGKTISSKNIFVLNAASDGVDQLSFSAVSNQPWLLVSPSGGLAPQGVTLHVVRAGLVAGSNSATVQINSNGGNRALKITASCSNAISNAPACGVGEVPTTPPVVTPPTPPKPPTLPPNPPSNPKPPTTPKPKPGVDESRTPPVRPTYQDISVNYKASEQYKWFRGKVATQTQRDAMEQTKTGVAMPELMRYLRTIPSCAPIYNSNLSQYNAITPRLGPNYEGRSLLTRAVEPREAGNGNWFVNPGGRHYSIENYAFLRAQKCLSSGNASYECAASNPSQSLLDLLDLRIEGNRCVKGATFLRIPPQEKFTNARGLVGLVFVKAGTRMPPLTPAQDALLEATHTTHQKVSDWRCAGIDVPANQPEPPQGAVQNAHIAFETSATTESQHHFFRLKDFAGAVDAGWSREDVCTIARIQDDAHHRWMANVRAGKWGHAREADNDHQLAHICMGLKEPRLLITMSCNAPIGQCPKQSCEQFIAEFRSRGSRYGTHSH